MTTCKSSTIQIKGDLMQNKIKTHSHVIQNKIKIKIQFHITKNEK